MIEKNGMARPPLRPDSGEEPGQVQHRWRLRSYLAILVTAVCAPLIAFQVYAIIKESHEKHAQAALASYHLAQTIAAQVTQFVRATGQGVAFLAERPKARALDPADCDPMIKILKAAREGLANVYTVDADGNFICSATDFDPTRVQRVDRKNWLESLLASGQPVIGAPLYSYLTGRWSVSLAQPLRDDAGKITGAAAISIDLTRFQFNAQGLHAPDGTAITILTGEGVVIARSAEAERWVGKSVADNDTVRAVLAQRSGTMRSTGLGGVERDYGFAPVQGTQWVVLAGIPAEIAKEQVRATLWNGVAAAGLALVLAVLFAWRLARRISTPVNGMAGAASAVAAGDDAARAGVAGPREIAAVAIQFNRMLEAQGAQRDVLRKSVAELQAAQDLLSAERTVLEVISTGVQLAEILEAIARNVETLAPGTLCSILLLDADGIHVRYGAAPSLPQEYNRAIEGAPIGPKAGSCGTAAYRNEQVIVSDIATDPLWADYAALALQHGLRACWSTPVRSSAGKVLGTFALYYREPRAPGPVDFDLIERWTHLTGIAIERTLAEQEINTFNRELEQRVIERTAQFDAAHASLQREIAERKRAEEAAQNNAIRLRTIIDTAADGIITIDSHGNIITFNHAAERLFGYAEAEVIGQNVKTLMPAPYRDEHDRYLADYLRTGKRKIIGIGREVVARRKDGSTFPIDLAVSEMQISGERRFTGILRDISERKRHEAALQRYADEIEGKNIELAHASEMKSQFLANMSHELRTPLNSIIGFSEILKDGLTGELNAEQRGFLGDIHASGEHLLSLINDILDLSKVEAGMMTLDPEPLAIDKLFHNSLTMLKEKAMKGRLRLDTEVEPGLPAFMADARKLKQIVYNLLSNAVKFTPEGGAVTLAARRVARAEVGLPAGVPGRLLPPPAGAAQAFVEISVKDSGIGIAPADIDKLFQAFMQIDSTLARTHQGTGLGLAMVLSLATLHGGTAGVVSAPGEGSTFFVWLPLEGTAQPAAAVALTPSPKGSAEIVAEPLALIVEDEDNAAQLIEQQLRAEGYRCIRAATGEEALVRAAKEHPQLITLDIFLPNMDGWEFLQRAKADSELAAIPVVIISIASDLDHGISLGATRVLQKPFSRTELAAALAGIGIVGDGDKRHTVLIVDDNPQAVELLASLLSEGNFNLLRAYGGREAIAATQRMVPDLILLDLMMPEVSGFDVVQALKARPDTAGIPIIVITAKDLTAEERAALNGQVLHIAEKASFDGGSFINEVRRALRRPPAG